MSELAGVLVLKTAASRVSVGESIGSMREGLCYCLIGLRHRADDLDEANPLLPSRTWDYSCLDRLFYHGQFLTIVWDKTGLKYQSGRGLTVFGNGKRLANSLTLPSVGGRLEQE